MRKLKAKRYRTTYQHNNSNKNILGHIPKDKFQQPILSCIVAVNTTFIPKKKNVYETYLNDYDMIKPTQSRQYPQGKSSIHDNKEL